MIKRKIFDFEVYPNWWCVVTYDTETGEQEIIRSDEDYKYKIRQMVLKTILIGFNIKRYDLKILHAIYNGNDPIDIYMLSKDIIDKKYENATHPFNSYNYWFKFLFIDLYDDWRFGSLKEFESNTGMSIVECDIPFDQEELNEDEKEEIVEYCIHDVKATFNMFKARKGYIQGKEILSEMFDIDIYTAYKSTNAKLTALVLKGDKHKYVKEETSFEIPDRLKEYVYKTLPKYVVDLFSSTSLYKHNLKLFDNDITIGNGGIHSTYSLNLYSVAEEGYKIKLIDVNSLYPMIMIVYNLISRKSEQPELYNKIKNLRMHHKKEMKKHEIGSKEYEKHKMIQQTLKLIINTAYGATKNKYNHLFDPFNATSTCFIGQLTLLALSNELSNADFKILQTNTDGIMVKYKVEQEDDLDRIVKNWEEITGFTMGYDDIAQVFQKDVNNYIMVDTDGNYKLRGKWSNQHDESLRNLNAPIVHSAVFEYYVNNIPVKDTIYKCNDIFKFAFTAKTSHKYDKTYYYVNGEKIGVNKINRVVACKDKSLGTLKKFKKVYKEQDDTYVDRYDKIAEIPEHCYIINDKIAKYSIGIVDKNWYVSFANNKIKDLIKV